MSEDWESDDFDWGRMVNKTVSAAKAAMLGRFGSDPFYGYHPKWISIEGRDDICTILCEMTVHDCGGCIAMNGKAIVIFPEWADAEKLDFMKDLAFAIDRAKGKKPWHGERGVDRQRKMLDALLKDIVLL